MLVNNYFFKYLGIIFFFRNSKFQVVSMDPQKIITTEKLTELKNICLKFINFLKK